MSPSTEVLSGRTAIVTGGAGGIGRAIVAALAERGARVAIWDLDGDVAVSVASSHGGIGIGVDIRDATSTAEAFEQTLDLAGSVEIVVNNAGVDVIGRFIDSDPASWDRILDVNLKGLFHVCRAVLPHLVERGSGTIINIGSDAGRVGSSGEAVYSATKGGVIAFTKTLAREHARDGITVNCVCPGPTDTPLLEQVAEYDQRLRDGLARAIPLRRVGQPEDIAGVVAFLAGEEAGYVTGQTISVSGGLTMA